MAGDENKHSGKQIGGNYRIVAELGRGGFGDVYLAQHIFFANRPQVAIKLLRASLFSPKERERFIQEAQLLNMLTHWFFRAFDEARLLVTAQNSLPKMSTYPFYVFVH